MLGSYVCSTLFFEPLKHRTDVLSNRLHMITSDTWFQGNEEAVCKNGGLDSPFHHKERRFPYVCDNSANLSITGVGQLEITDGIISEGVDAQADKV
jgi:hypothetical protein